jgi:hypothetical protein
VSTRPALSATALFALLLGCGTAVAGDYVVEVSGTEGTPFGGVCLMITGDARVTRPAVGTVPSTFGLSGDIVSCAIQRKAGAGQLHIVIRSTGGRVVDESLAAQPFGVIMAAGR